MARTKKPSDKKRSRSTLDASIREGESEQQAYARIRLDPIVRHAANAMDYSGQLFGGSSQLTITDGAQALDDFVSRVETGDLKAVSRMLTSQAYSLDTMFTELSRRSLLNAGEYLDASERYMRLALKAQTACRGTLEALTKLHQPREQIVKHVHVNQGGQAVVADNIHQHQGGGQNEKSVKQSHATGAAGESAAMLGQDAPGNGVPISSGKRQKKVPDARRD